MVIVCSNEKEFVSYFISKHHMYKRTFVAPSSDNNFKDYLISKFSQSSQAAMDLSSLTGEGIPASIVDYEGSVHLTDCMCSV